MENYTAFTFILIAFSVTIQQVQGYKRTCNLFSTPHPNGVCGSKLAQAHENLCFIIRLNYPQFFPKNKRFSVSDLSDKDEQALLGDVDDADVGTGSGHGLMREMPPLLTSSSKQISTLRPEVKSGNLPENVAEGAFLHVLAKRGPLTTGSLVCDCCYGPCSTRVLARYC